VVMGFLELAAALKFFRTAEIRLLPSTEYFTYELVLGGWVAISFACGLYLLNIYRLPHDEEKPNIGVVRLLFALLFLGLGIYLMPAMFKGIEGKPQRPSGTVYAWVESFLLPESQSHEWSTDLKESIEQSRKTGQPLFVDFTGVTCTNCKYNESTVFTRPEIQQSLEKFELVQIYGDEVPARAYTSDPGDDARNAEAIANAKFQLNLFGDVARPLYAILVPKPDGKLKLLGIREGKINDPGEFATWLRDSLEQAKK
jgi:Thioredoxin-like